MDTSATFRGQADQPQAAGGTDAHHGIQQLADSPPSDSTENGLAPSSRLVRQALDLIQPEFETQT